MNEDIDFDDLDKTKFVCYTFLGFLGVRAVLYPPALVKTRMQVQRGHTQYRSTPHAFSAIVRTEGLLGLYRGFWTSSLGLLARQVYFQTYEYVRIQVKVVNRSSGLIQSEKYETILRNTLGGGSASLVSQVIATPIDILSQRLMVEKQKTSALSVVREIYSSGGIKGFYRGYFASVAQFAPASGIWWGTYAIYVPQVESSLPQALGDYQKMLAQAIAGFAAGATSCIITNPLDVLRTRLQVEKHSGDNNLRQVARTLLREEGARGLMKGLGARLVGFAPASSLVISTYELIKRLSRKDALDHHKTMDPRLQRQKSLAADKRSAILLQRTCSSSGNSSV